MVLLIAEVVTSVRLRLPLVTEAEAADMRAGRRRPDWHPDYPRKDDVDAAGMVRDGDPWGPRHIVRAFDGQVCGSIGFFGPPDAGADGVPETEVGYGLVEDARGHGAAPPPPPWNSSTSPPTRPRRRERSNAGSAVSLTT